MIGTQMNADFQDSNRAKIFSAYLCDILHALKQMGFLSFPNPGKPEPRRGDS
jgi:hypothetical protein